MFATDLSYVRHHLGKLKPSELRAIAEEYEVSPKTLRRIIDQSVSTSAVTISKLALHFKTKERRAK